MSFSPCILLRRKQKFIAYKNKGGLEIERGSLFGE